MEGVINFIVENIFIVVFSVVLSLILTHVLVYVAGWLKGKNISVDIRVTIDETKAEEERHAKKGLILILSHYRSFSRPKPMEEDDLRRFLQQKKYQEFDFQNSNFEHTIKAIEAHSTKLDHCWIIGSHATSVRASSVEFIETFVEYLKEEKGINCQFHYGEEYAIPINNDALICKKAYELANEIYGKAKKHNLSPKDIIVDVTGGIKSMNLGFTLAALHEDRDIQVIGSKYNDRGNPIDPRCAVRIHFEPKIRS
ncbi:hypothetical protein M1N54_03080 [Thermodesulfovibrionales bacterium]|nr:hypothetical protein [Thermodesulfovibrionales bacterium]